MLRLSKTPIRTVVLPDAGDYDAETVYEDHNDELWIGTEGRGVFRQSGTQLAHYMVKDGLVNNFVRAFLEGRDGSIWIATDEGVSHWQNGHFTSYQERDGLCYFSTRSLAEDRNGDIW